MEIAWVVSAAHRGVWEATQGQGRMRFAVDLEKAKPIRGSVEDGPVREQPAAFDDKGGWEGVLQGGVHGNCWLGRPCSEAFTLFRLALPACPWPEQQEDLVWVEQLGEVSQQELPCPRRQLVWPGLSVELGDRLSRYVSKSTL